MSLLAPERMKGHAPAPFSYKSTISFPLRGSSDAAEAISDALRRMAVQATSSFTQSARIASERSKSDHEETAERLFDSLSAAKVLTARVAMHLSSDWRSQLFEQLDELLDAEDWHDEDEPVTAKSFFTFLRTITHVKPEVRPGLGVSHAGNLIGAWTKDRDALTMEFLPDDTVRWVLSCLIDGEVERAAGISPVRRLPDTLAPYRPDRWFVRNA